MEDNSTYTLTVPATALVAIAALAAAKDVRFYLNGVLLDMSPGGTTLVGTDGNKLGAYCVPAQPDSPPLPAAQVIIPADLIKPFKPDGTITVTVGPELDSNSTCRALLLSNGVVTVSGDTIGGKYPDWRRVVPREVAEDAPAAQFDPGLIADLAKAARILRGRPGKSGGIPPLRVAHNGRSGALVTIDGDDAFVGVLMPMRVEAQRRAPAWL